MKKLYTLLLAAAVTLTAAAASPFQGVRNDSPMRNEVKFTDSKVANLTYSSEAVAKAAMTANSRANEFPSIDSKYMLISYPDNEETSTADANPCHLYEDESDGAGMGYYFLENFIMSGTDKIECTMEYEDVAMQGQTVTVLKLVIPSGTTLYSYNGETYKLRLFGYDEEGNPGLYSNDIEFWYAQGAWVFPFNEGMGIAWINSQSRGSWIVDPTMVPTNGTYEGLEVTDVNDDGSIADSQDIVTDVYAEFDEESNTLLLANFGDFHKLITLSVDLTKQEAVATDQTVADIPYNPGTGYVYIDGKLMDMSPDATNFTAALRNENGKTIMTNEQSWIIIEPNEILGNTNNVWYSIILGSEITLDFEIPGLTGISNVTVADENAPVEYYNLQGVRVANPESGLYIKRQGNKATKVLVK